MAPPTRVSRPGGTSVGIGMGFKFEPNNAVQKLSLGNARVQAAVEQEFPAEVEKVATDAQALLVERTPRSPAGAPVDPRRNFFGSGKRHLADDWVVKRLGGRGAFESKRFSVENLQEQTVFGAQLLKILEYGSSPHQIVALRRRYLAFMAGGQLIFRHKVSHPGTRPYAMVRQTAADSEVRITALMRQLALRAVQIWQAGR